MQANPSGIMLFPGAHHELPLSDVVNLDFPGHRALEALHGIRNAQLCRDVDAFEAARTTLLGLGFKNLSTYFPERKEFSGNQDTLQPDLGQHECSNQYFRVVCDHLHGYPDPAQLALHDGFVAQLLDSECFLWWDMMP